MGTVLKLCGRLEVEFFDWGGIGGDGRRLVEGESELHSFDSARRVYWFASRVSSFSVARRQMM